MMKKVMVLMLVLGMASLANAQLQISVHNNPPGGETWDPMNPADSTITIAPSGTLMLDIWTTTGIYSGVGEGYFLLGVAPAKGTLTGGESLWPSETGVVYYPGLGTAYLPPGETGDLMTIGTFLSAPGMTGTIFDGIIFHCESIGDATINLYLTDWVTPTLIDSVVIHQIVPEPVTIALLGFGGLLLRRRKK